jgi:hypothetical protein
MPAHKSTAFLAHHGNDCSLKKLPFFFGSQNVRDSTAAAQQ